MAAVFLVVDIPRERLKLSISIVFNLLEQFGLIHNINTACKLEIR